MGRYQRDWGCVGRPEPTDATPDEDSTATDMELSALHESFDAPDDQNEEKADNTPDEYSTVTDMELDALQESHDAAEDHERPDALAPDQQIWAVSRAASAT